MSYCKWTGSQEKFWHGQGVGFRRIQGPEAKDFKTEPFIAVAINGGGRKCGMLSLVIVIDNPGHEILVNITLKHNIKLQNNSRQDHTNWVDNR